MVQIKDRNIFAPQILIMAKRTTTKEMRNKLKIEERKKLLKKATRKSYVRPEEFRVEEEAEEVTTDASDSKEQDKGSSEEE